MVSKISDEKRLVSTPTRRATFVTSEDDVVAIIQLPSPLVQREIWKRQRKCWNSPSKGAYASLCAEFDIDPATSTTVGIFHHLECLESRRYMTKGEGWARKQTLKHQKLVRCWLLTNKQNTLRISNHADNRYGMNIKANIEIITDGRNRKRTKKRSFRFILL